MDLMLEAFEQGKVLSYKEICQMVGVPEEQIAEGSIEDEFFTLNDEFIDALKDKELRSAMIERAFSTVHQGDSMPKKEQSLDKIQNRQDTYDNKWGKYTLHKKHCKKCKKTFRWAGRERTKGYLRAMFNKNCELCMEQAIEFEVKHNL